MDYNRFSDACFIQQGACNVRGIARALVKAADAAAEDGEQPGKDLAVRLIVAQLAWLCGTDGIGGVNGIEYGDAIRQCKERASTQEQQAA
jgi:hypothetical protein